MEKPLASFEKDLKKLENLVHSIKTMNTDTENRLFDFETNFNEQKVRIEDLEPMYRNSFSINELLELITEMNLQERFTDYSNATYQKVYN